MKEHVNRERFIVRLRKRAEKRGKVIHVRQAEGNIVIVAGSKIFVNHAVPNLRGVRGTKPLEPIPPPKGAHIDLSRGRRIPPPRGIHIDPFRTEQGKHQGTRDGSRNATPPERGIHVEIFKSRVNVGIKDDAKKTQVKAAIRREAKRLQINPKDLSISQGSSSYFQVEAPLRLIRQLEQIEGIAIVEETGKKRLYSTSEYEKVVQLRRGADRRTLSRKIREIEASTGITLEVTGLDHSRRRIRVAIASPDAKELQKAERMRLFGRIEGLDQVDRVEELRRRDPLVSAGGGCGKYVRPDQ